MPKSNGLMAQVVSRMAATETLISDRHAQSMLGGLLAAADRIEDPLAAWHTVRSELCSMWGFDDGPESSRKPFIYSDGVAVIPVHGILINRFNWCWGFVTGYDFIRKQKNLAEADPDVKLIVYDHDSPGGEAAGCDELAREIYASRGGKPSLALVNTLSASGGFWLAAPCDRIVCAPSGSVGSIGVYIQHMNIAKMLAEFGVEVEFIKNGEYKTSGNSYEPLSDKDREYLQGMVDERAVEFHRAVAEFRGIEESVVKDTQARVMRPTEAIALGLIDAAESPATAVSSFVAELSNDCGDDEPTTTDEEDPQEDVMAEMTSEDRAAVAADTKARIKGIMTHDEAKGRESLAEHLAYNTDMSVTDAAAALAAAPKASAEPESKPDDKPEAKPEDKPEDKPADDASKPSHFEKAMDSGKHPNVGGAGDKGREEAASKVDEIMGDYAAAFGPSRVRTTK